MSTPLSGPGGLRNVKYPWAFSQRFDKDRRPSPLEVADHSFGDAVHRQQLQIRFPLNVFALRRRLPWLAAVGWLPSRRGHRRTRLSAS